MPKTTKSQCNMTSGEISPRALGRFDLAKFANAVKVMENWLIYQLGGALFRPGTVFAEETKTSSLKPRLIPFQFSTSQAYVIEVGNLYMRFYANNGQLLMSAAPAWTTPTPYVVGNFVTFGGLQYYCIVNHTSNVFATDLLAGDWIRQDAYEIPSPYLTAHIPQIHYTQDADTMYLTHPLYPPYKLQRQSALYFTLTPVDFVRGPFLDKNITTTTITPSADAGAGITLTASVAIFDETHEGSLWRVKSGVVKITHVAAGGLQLTAIGDVQVEPTGVAGNLATGPAATTDWSEGAFSGYRGYPATCTFHEQRLIYGYTAHQPQTFWASIIGGYDNFNIPTTVTSSDAFTFTIAAGQVNAIRWISSGPSGVEIGTSGGTFSNASGTTVTLTPSNPNVHNDTDDGVANFLPKRISSCLYFITSSLFYLLELVYDWLTNREKANDMTLLADHILRDGSGAVDIARQQSPNNRLWIVRSDGQIAVLTRNAQQDVMGWSRIVAGSDAKGAGLFESVAIIRKDGDDDQVWVIVKRNINGTVKRYVEYFSSEFFTKYYEPVRLDSSLSYDVPIVISGATQANPVVITTTLAHGLVDGDQIKIDNVFGMTELNGNIYIVDNAAANTFELNDEFGVTIDGTLFTAYLSGGQVRKMFTSFSGLDHLVGETVSVTVDGGVPAGQQTFLVPPGGTITLLHKAAVAHAGLPYYGTLQLLKFSDGSPTTGQTKTRRVFRTTLRVFQSLGCLVGQDINHMQTKYFGTPNVPLGHTPSLFTGDFEVFPDTWWAKDMEMIIQQLQPLPFLLLAVIVQSEVEE